MAGTERKSDPALVARPGALHVEALAKEAKRFPFFLSVQLLERLSPHAVRVGEGGPPQKEALRFVHNPDLIFHASDVERITPRVLRDGIAYTEVMTNFFGLFGSASPLSAPFSEDVLFADADGSGSLRAFYDIFHHRLISLLYRAWKKYRFSAGFRADGRDPFTARSLAFVGVDAEAGLDQEGLPAAALLGLAPLLLLRTRSARALKMLFASVMPELPTSIECFVERRVEIDEDQRAMLGEANMTLGHNFSLGRTVLDRSGRYRIRIGPVDYNTYEALGPGGRYHATLRKIVQQFSRGILEAEVELSLSPEEAPKFRLGSSTSILGVTTTLRSVADKPMRMRFVLSDTGAEVRGVVD